MPPAALLPVLLDLYPDLKVVLVVRDSQEWWKSFERLHKLSFAWYVPLLCSIIPGFRWVPAFLEEWKYLADDLMIASGGQPGEYGPGESL